MDLYIHVYLFAFAEKPFDGATSCARVVEAEEGGLYRLHLLYLLVRGRLGFPAVLPHLECRPPWPVLGDADGGDGGGGGDDGGGDDGEQLHSLQFPMLTVPFFLQ